MKHVFPFGALLAICAPQLVVGQNTRDAVIGAEARFAAEAAESGTPKAFMNFSTPTSVVVENGQLSAAHDVWRTRPHQPGTKLSWRPVMADAAQSGELGYTTGPWTFSKNGETLAAGDYLTVWRKQANGEWKFAVDMGIEHGPTATAPGTDVLRPQAFVAGATPVPVPPTAILTIDQKFATAELHAPAKTYQDNLSSDARLLRPGQLPLYGPAVRVAVETFTRAYLYSATDGYMAASGDLGYVYGTLRRPALDPKAPEETGTFLRIWRREAAAGWRIVAEVLNVASPTITPAAATNADPATAPTGQVVGGH